MAGVLGVSADAIRNFSEEATFNIISNNYHDHSSSVNYQFNPIEKIVELYKEKIELYERMLKEKDAIIEKLMSKSPVTTVVDDAYAQCTHSNTNNGGKYCLCSLFY